MSNRQSDIDERVRKIKEIQKLRGSILLTEEDIQNEEDRMEEAYWNEH